MNGGEDDDVTIAVDAKALGGEFVDVECREYVYTVSEITGTVTVTRDFRAEFDLDRDIDDITLASVIQCDAETFGPTGTECPSDVTCTGERAPVVDCVLSHGLTLVNGRASVFCGAITERTPNGAPTERSGVRYNRVAVRIE